MINGTSFGEKLASRHDPRGDPESDGGDDLSNYSSCGEESEFERYCSANSAMGTPSLIGSSYQDSELGSFKSFKLGGESASLKSFGAKKRLSEFYSDEKGNNSGLLDLDRTQRFVASAVDLMGNLGLDDNWGDEGGSKIEGVVDEFRGICEGKGVSESVGKGGNEGGGVANGEGEDGLSRYELSDGDDSMFGGGSDDERKAVMYYGKNRDELRGKGETKFGIMTGGADFGADDLDNFILESNENNYGFMGHGEQKQGDGNGIDLFDFAAANSVVYPNTSLADRQKDVGGSRGGVGLVKLDVGSLSTNSTDLVKHEARVEPVEAALVLGNQDSDMDELGKYLQHNSGYDLFEMNKETTTEEAQANEKSKILVPEPKVKHQDTNISKGVSIHHDTQLGDSDLKKKGVGADGVSESIVKHNLVQLKDKEDKDVNNSLPSTKAGIDMYASNKKNNVFLVNKIEDHFAPVKTRDFELNNFYDEIVNDMEDILLDSGESPGSGFTHGKRIYESRFSRPSRDGGSNASTSGMDQQPLRIDGIDVVGSRQKEGDVSFSERLVGVRKYTVYKIRVWSGENQWEVERRYREFCNLYHRLKKLFTDRGLTLPSPWSFVDKESRKLFGNASPDVIADRSVLIQECLQSLLHPEFSFNSMNALIHFLSPSEEVPDSPESPSRRGSRVEDFSSFGKTISLVVQIRPPKSMKQILDAQHYKCAGCHKDFDDGMTTVQGFVQALGWGKPRFCEYSGQLFCSSCHNNDTAILPAKVLHHWDFTRYPVCQLAKSYLDSIHDQPMLCVSAVNPFLFSKVPTLQQVANMRSRIKTMLPYVRCPFRGSIYKGLGSRRYLLESNDFFALRDLIDLSKGVFSALPVMVETVSRKILEHITEHCLVCYDVGIPCGARQACDNTLSLIFPFQEGEVEKCKSCELVFHKNCFKKTASCPCGARFKPEKANQSASQGNHGTVSTLTIPGGTEPSTGLLTGLFSMVIPRRTQTLRRQHSRHDTDIVMGSLPNNAL